MSQYVLPAQAGVPPKPNGAAGSGYRRAAAKKERLEMEVPKDRVGVVGTPENPAFFPKVPFRGGYRYALTKVQWDDIIRRAKDDELYANIAASYSVSTTMLSRLLVSRGIRKVKPKGAAAKAVSEVATPKPDVKPDMAQTRRIIELLDKHFDEDRGMYLDGLSDQKVAERLDVPRVMVESVREGAYGPLRVRPEAVEMRRKAEELSEKLARMVAEFETRARLARSEIDALLEMAAKL